MQDQASAATLVAPPTAPLTSTGTPCRVCHVDDADERVQPDLHRRCMESATNRAIERRERNARARVTRQRRGRELGRAELVERLARARGGAADHAGAPTFGDGDPPRRRGRPTKAAARARQVDQADHDHDQDDDGLTADEVAAVELITRGGGLSTGGLGAEGLDDV